MTGVYYASVRESIEIPSWHWSAEEEAFAYLWGRRYDNVFNVFGVAFGLIDCLKNDVTEKPLVSVAIPFWY